MHGTTNGLAPMSLDATSDPVAKIETCVNADGERTGIRFVTVSGAILNAGRLCGDGNQTAFDDIDSAAPFQLASG